MAMAMAMMMMKQQRSKKLNWEGMLLKWCCLSSAAHSYGTHHLPVRRWEEGMSSKPPSDGLEQEPSAGVLLQDGRPAYSPPLPPPPAYDSDGPAYNPPRISAFWKYVTMGWLRPWSLDEAEYRFRPSGGIQDDNRPAHSDGTPAPRWWEVKFKKPWRLPPSGTPGILLDDRPPPQLSMVGSNSNWEGRLKRWKLGHTFRPYPNYSLEDFVAHRVNSIAQYFKVPTDSDSYDDPDEDPDEINILESEQFEYWLDEVQGYFEFMDLAHELHSIDCLFPLLHHVLVYPHAACTRAKTAELVTTMVHNNPRSQQLVMELHGLEPLSYNFTSDPDATSRTKALGAISALIRNNKPGITAFRETIGYAALGDALSSENVWFQREALNLIQYLLHENSSDCNTVTELGLPCIMMHLASSDDAEVRVAALGGLLVLARDEECAYQKKRDKEGGNSDQQLVKNDDKLKQVLQELIKRISAMAPEDLVAAREEIQLVDSLWNACYNEPSSLGEKSLLLLPCEKDGNIVTELGLPRIMIQLASSDDAEVREAALRGLLVLARNEGGNKVKNDDKLKQVLQERIEGISAMAPEDLGAAREERHLVDSLWNACYNEPWMVTMKEEVSEGLDALESPKLTQIDDQLTTTDVTSLQNTIHVLNSNVQHLTEQMTNMFQQLQTVLPVHHHRQAQTSGGGIQDDHPAHHSDGTHHSPARRYVAMGWLKPWSLYEAERMFRPSGGIQDDRPAHSDGTPAPRWWEVKFKKPWRLPSGTSVIQDDRPAPPPPQLSMVETVVISNWEGRLKRWKRGHTFRPYPNYSVQDVVAQRVSTIAEYFKVPELPDDFEIGSVEPEQFEYWLDEVQGYFEFMDLAHELHSIDCLFPLLHHVLVYPRAASIRAKAAELVTAMVHNNPWSQHLVMELLGHLEPLWYNFTSDPDVTSRTKALGAISALIRNNKSGITAFHQKCGCYARLGDALSSENVRFQREALNLFQYLLHENCSDFESITELPFMMMRRASSDDAEARVAALRGLLVLAKDEENTYKNKIKNEDGSIGQLVKNDVKLKQLLQELIKRISAMAPEDLVAAREEIQLVDSLWNACYNEPSSLKLFEPSPRAWAAADQKLPIETMLV